MTFSTHVLIATSGGRSRLLARTLASLARCVQPQGFEGCVIIENGRATGVEELVAGYAGPLGAVYAHVDEANKSGALNTVLRNMDPGLVIFLDDDVRVDEDILVRYAHCAEIHGLRTFFGGPAGCDYATPPPEWLYRNLPRSAAGWSPAQFDPAHFDYFLGYNWAAFVGDIAAVGYFDTGYGPGSASGATGQETAMQRRLLQAGARPVYVPEAMVWHYVPKERCNWKWVVRRALNNGKEAVQATLPAGDEEKYKNYLKACLWQAFTNFCKGVVMASRYNLLRALVHFNTFRGAWRARDLRGAKPS